MFIVDLTCAEGHRFEGWYDDAREYHALASQHDITCPLCGSDEVARVPSATRISTTKTRGDHDAASEQRPAAPARMPMAVQKAVSRMLQQVRLSHEDVGEQFAERAIAMHRGEAPVAPIHGRATQEQEERLDEEGVPYLKLPIPDIEKN